MKHERVNGILINTEKKWYHLKDNQKSWICERAKEMYSMFVLDNNRPPNKKESKDIINNLYDVIVSERNIWIPFDEVSKNVLPRFSRYKTNLR